MKNIAVITYNVNHLKTQQIILNLVNYKNFNLTIFALPFKPFKKRDVFFAHRPSQLSGALPKDLAEYYGLKFIEVSQDTDIPSGFDSYLVTGAGILSKEFVFNKKIINGHPGIIPAVRGLDAFKWSILNNEPLGNTLHYIDAEVDSGEIITIIPTPIFSDDTIEKVACRHYDIEISMLSNFDIHIKNPQNSYRKIEEKIPKMRMKKEQEKEMVAHFDSYLEKMMKLK